MVIMRNVSQMKSSGEMVLGDFGIAFENRDSSGFSIWASSAIIPFIFIVLSEGRAGREDRGNRLASIWVRQRPLLISVTVFFTSPIELPSNKAATAAPPMSSFHAAWIRE